MWRGGGPSRRVGGCDENEPDIVIVDLVLKETNGLDLIKDLQCRYPKLSILVLSMYDEGLYAERVLRAGARGYVTKQEATQNVMAAIRRVLGGEIYLSDRMSSHLLQKVAKGQPAPVNSPVEILSDRELEVFQLIGCGHGTREIAEVLGIGLKTIESYRTRIKEKLKISNSVLLMQHAIRWMEDGGQR